jgi:hypothetical protein
MRHAPVGQGHASFVMPVEASINGGELMKSTVMFGIAVIFGSSFIAGAQTTRTETKVKGHDAKTVTYTGCVRPGSEATSYVLMNPIPISQTTKIGTSGVPETETTYALVPEATVALQPEVGHKVQVTGIIAKGDVKKETKTKTDGQHEVKTEETIKGDHSVRQFHVLSVRDLGESCS